MLAVVGWARMLFAARGVLAVVGWARMLFAALAFGRRFISFSQVLLAGPRTNPAVYRRALRGEGMVS